MKGVSRSYGGDVVWKMSSKTSGSRRFVVQTAVDQTSNFTTGVSVEISEASRLRHG